MYRPMKQRKCSCCPWLVGAVLALLVAACDSPSAHHETLPQAQSPPGIVCAPTARGCHPRPFVPIPSQPAARHIVLCGSVSSLSRLVVTRSDAFPQNHFHFSFPSRVVVSKPIQVRAVARALCALPVMPSGTYHCPADFGIVYHLMFSGPALKIPPVSAEISGCEVVSGVGPISRWMADSPHLWSTLGTAMGLTKPGQKTFAGDRASG